MSGGKQQTQNTVTEPWEEQKPYLQEAMQGAQSAYQSGQGFNPYPNSTVVPFSSQTTSALSGMQNIAGQGDPLNQAAMGQAQGLLGSGAYGIATGENNIGTEGDLRGLLSQSTNPYYQGVVDREAGKLTDDVNRGFSNSGRTGSMSNVNEIIDQVGGFRDQMASNQFNQNIANQRGILGDISGLQGQNISNQLQGGGLLNQTAGMTPQLYQQQYAPSERMAQVGSQHEAMSTAQLQDQINRFQQTQQEPWQRLAAYQGLIGGGSLGSSTSQSAMGPSNFAAPLGGALGGAQLGSMFGPWGTALGAIGGGILGAM